MKNKNIYKAFLKATFVLVVLYFVFLFANHVSESDQLTSVIQQWGYIGVFLVAIVSGFNFLFPVPGAAFLPIFLSAGLDTYLVVLFLSAGLTTADSIAYLFGSAGRHLVEGEKEKKMIMFIEKIQTQNKFLLPFFIIAYASFVPIPNEIIVAPLAFMGYKFKYIFPLIFIGNFVFNILAVWGIYQFI